VLAQVVLLRRRPPDQQQGGQHRRARRTLHGSSSQGLAVPPRGLSTTARTTLKRKACRKNRGPRRGRVFGGRRSCRPGGEKQAPSEKRVDTDVDRSKNKGGSEV